MLIRRKTKEKIFLSVFILMAISLAGINITVYLLSSFSSTKAASSIALTSKYNSSEDSVSLEWVAASDEANNYGYRIIRSEWEESAGSKNPSSERDHSNRTDRAKCLVCLHSIESLYYQTP